MQSIHCIGFTGKVLILIELHQEGLQADVSGLQPFCAYSSSLSSWPGGLGQSFEVIFCAWLLGGSEFSEFSGG
jgi:hypothetical protein